MTLALPSESTHAAPAVALATESSDRGGPSDADLVQRARSKDGRAEELLYRRHVHYIQALLIKLLANHAEAEDAVQETFVIALDQLGTLRDGAAFRGWLAQIAVSRARRRFRKRKLLRLLGIVSTIDGDTAVEQAVGPSASEGAHADLATIRQLLDRLPAEERLAWSLRHLAGHSLEEAAQHCRCSLATVKRRIAAADAFIHLQFGDRQETS